MRTFDVMVDSSCDLPEEYIKANDIKVMPMPFTLNGKEFSDGYWDVISGKEYYDAMRTGGVAATSQVNPDVFLKKFKEYAEQDKELLVVALSGGLSGTYQSGVTALEELKETHPDCKIYVVNSLTATIGHGLTVMMAIKKGEEGASAAEAAEWIAQKTKNVFSFFTVDDLMYLHRGGRLSKMSAMAGSLLGFKPILNVKSDGTLILREKARGRKTSLETLVTHMKRCVKPGDKMDTVVISHGDCEQDAEWLAARVRESFDVRDVVVMLMGPVISAHVGPGVIAMFFEGDMLRTEYEEKYYEGK